MRVLPWQESASEEMVDTLMRTSSAICASRSDGFAYLDSSCLVVAYTWRVASLMQANLMESCCCLARVRDASSLEVISLILSSAWENLSLGEGEPEAMVAVRRMVGITKYFFMILLYHCGGRDCTGAKRGWVPA